MLYYASHDDYCARPVGIAPGEPVVFIGVGSPGALHAASYLSDVVPVGEIRLYDLYTPQLDWTQRCYDLMQGAQSRKDYFEKLFGIKFKGEYAQQFGVRFPGDELQFGDADLRGMQQALGLKEPVRLTEGRHDVVDLPWPQNSQEQDIDGRYAQLRLGFEYGADGLQVGNATGYLSQQCFPLRISASFHQGDIAEVIFEQCRKRQPTVVWLSNAWLWPSDEHSGPLAAAVLEAMRTPYIELWHAAQGKYRKTLIDRGCLKNDAADHSPHTHATVAISEVQLPGTTVYVYPGKVPPPTSLPWAVTVGIDDYLHKVMGATNHVFHMCSLADHQNTVLPLPVAAGAYEKFGEALRKAAYEAEQTLVLEHNAETFERGGLHNSGMLVNTVDDIAGRRRRHLRWCPGRKDLRRNFIAVY